MAGNRDVPVADTNVEKLSSPTQGSVHVQENAAIIETDLILKNKFQIPFCYTDFKVVFITGNL